jgi:GlpG protein
MIKAASLPTETNLLNFSKLLHAQGLAHRINEESGQQVIWVASEREAEVVQNALEKWLSAGHDSVGERSADNSSAGNNPREGIIPDLRVLINNTVTAIYYYPITALLFAVCIVVAVISGLGSYPQRLAILFYPLLANDGFLNLLTDIKSFTEFARTFTPMFLHFGELHLIFNMLWLWYFGRQLESIQSTWSFVALVLVTSFVSNTTQYMVNDANNFGGMSGVVYGLVGYTWVVHKLMPKSYLSLNSNMLVFFVVALVAMEVLASSLVATAAHIGGLFSGLVLGGGVVIYNRYILKNTAVGHMPISRK